MLLHQPMSILFRQDSRPDSGRGTSPLSVLSWPNQVPTAPFAPRPQTICPQGPAGYLDSYPGAPGPQKDSNLRLGWPETLERGEEHGKKSPVRAVTLPEKQPGFCCLKQAMSLTQALKCPHLSPLPSLVGRSYCCCSKAQVRHSLSLPPGPTPTSVSSLLQHPCHVLHFLFRTLQAQTPVEPSLYP